MKENLISPAFNTTGQPWPRKIGRDQGWEKEQSKQVEWFGTWVEKR